VGGGALIWNRVLVKVAQQVRAEGGPVIDSFVSSDHGLLDGIVLDYGTKLLAR
jgi:exopolyphosphatase / guanosine-5'-triphosphate,3'-diphosphate pyrophosphatase